MPSNPNSIFGKLAGGTPNNQGFQLYQPPSSIPYGVNVGQGQQYPSASYPQSSYGATSNGTSYGGVPNYLPSTSNYLQYQSSIPGLSPTPASGRYPATQSTPRRQQRPVSPAEYSFAPQKSLPRSMPTPSANGVTLWTSPRGEMTDVSGEPGTNIFDDSRQYGWIRKRYVNPSVGLTTATYYGLPANVGIRYDHGGQRLGWVNLDVPSAPLNPMATLPRPPHRSRPLTVKSAPNPSVMSTKEAIARGLLYPGDDANSEMGSDAVAHTGYDRADRHTEEITPGHFRTVVKYRDGYAGMYGDAASGAHRLGPLYRPSNAPLPNTGNIGHPTGNKVTRAIGAIVTPLEQYNEFQQQYIYKPTGDMVMGTLNNAADIVSTPYITGYHDEAAAYDWYRAKTAKTEAEKRSYQALADAHRRVANEARQTGINSTLNFVPFANPVVHALQGKFTQDDARQAVIDAALLGIGGSHGLDAGEVVSPELQSARQAYFDRTGAEQASRNTQTVPSSAPKRSYDQAPPPPKSTPPGQNGNLKVSGASAKAGASDIWSAYGADNNWGYGTGAKTPSTSTKPPTPRAWSDLLGIGEDASPRTSDSYQTDRGPWNLDTESTHGGSPNVPEGKPSSDYAPVDFSYFKTLKQAKLWADKHGTQFVWDPKMPDDLKLRIAGIVAQGLDPLHAGGHVIHRAIVIRYDNFDAATNALASTTDMSQLGARHGESILKVNPNITEYWENPAAYAQSKFNNAIWSTADPLHPWSHEVSHSAQWAKNKARYDAAAKSDFMGKAHPVHQTIENLVGKNVSAYARTHPHEFMAEVFAMLHAGEPVSPELISEYKALGGIDPRKGKR